VQVAIYLFLNYRDALRSGPAEKAEAMLAFEFDKIDKVKVEGSDKKTIEVLKKDGKWILPSLFNFPIAKEKVDQVIKALAEVKRSWPMGNTKAAGKQFEVTDEKFERKITFFTGDKSKTLYLGNSPSYRKVFARLDDEDKTYSIEFNAMDAAVEAKDWADHDLYKMERNKITTVKFPDFTLNKDNATFAVSNLKADEVTNNTEVDNLLSRLQNPAFEDVIASEKYEAGAKILDYTLVGEDKVDRVFSYFTMKADPKLAPPKTKAGEGPKGPEDIYAVLKVSDLPFFFKVHKIRVDELSKFTHGKFIKKKDAAEKSSSHSLDKEAGQVQIPSGGPG